MKNFMATALLLSISGVSFALPVNISKTSYPNPDGLSVESKVTVSESGRVDHRHVYTNGTAGIDGLIGYHLDTVIYLKDQKGNVLKKVENKQWFNCQCGGKTSKKFGHGSFNLPVNVAKKIDPNKSSIIHHRRNGPSKDLPIPSILLNILK